MLLLILQPECNIITMYYYNYIIIMYKYANVVTALQVYNAVQRAAAMQCSPSAKSTTKTSEQTQTPDTVCVSTSNADEDSKQCKAPQPVEVPVLVSGAGHDSLAMADLTQASVIVATAPCDLAQPRRRLHEHDCAALASCCKF